MALSRQQKQDTVAQVSELLANSKMTVYARYQGTPVKDMQQLRQTAADNGTQVMVVKNRLFKKALEANDSLKAADTGDLKGQLLYAFNPEDEVAPAQNLANFAKTNPQIEFVGGITRDGQVMSVDDLKQMAALPTKEQLRAQLVATIGSPVSSFVTVLSGNLRGVMNVLNARASGLEN